MVILIALASGVLMSLIGVAYNMGRSRGLQATHIATFIGLIGAVCFAGFAGGESLRSTPSLVIWVGVIAGLAQYLGIAFLGAALRRGPLSPAWCAAAMLFPPAIIYAWIVLGERPGVMRLAGSLLACSCVIMASIHGSSGAVSTKTDENNRKLSTRLVYGLLLIGVMIFASSINVSLKMLGGRILADGRSMVQAYGLAFLAICYVTLGFLMLIDTFMHPPPAASRRSLLPIGLLATVGSVGCFGLLRLVAQYPAALVFPVNAVASLLGASLSSVFFFGEKVTPLWFGMVGAGCVAVVLVGLA